MGPWLTLPAACVPIVQDWWIMRSCTIFLNATCFSDGINPSMFWPAKTRNLFRLLFTREVESASLWFWWIDSLAELLSQQLFSYHKIIWTACVLLNLTSTSNSLMYLDLNEPFCLRRSAKLFITTFGLVGMSSPRIPVNKYLHNHLQFWNWVRAQKELKEAALKHSFAHDPVNPHQSIFLLSRMISRGQTWN